MQRMPEAVRAQDPLLAAGMELAARFGRDPNLPPALMAWTDPLFADETGKARRLREVACWMSDIGSHDHPEFRAEQAFLRVLRQPGIGLDHHARAFLALAIVMRYEVDSDAGFLRPARLLLEVSSAHRAEMLGVALRLAYTLSAGTPDLLAGTALQLTGGRLILQLEEDSGVFAGESVMRRLDRLAQAVGLESATEAARDPDAASIRSARPDEADTVRDVVHAAYRHYIARIGKPPGPMLDDYAARIADGQMQGAGGRGHDCRGPGAGGGGRGFPVGQHPGVARGSGQELRPRALDQIRRNRGACRRGFAEIRLYTHEKTTGKRRCCMRGLVSWRRIGSARRATLGSI